MRYILFFIIAAISLACSSSEEKFRLNILPDQPNGAENWQPHVSDYSMRIQVRWKNQSSTSAKITILDGAGNPVLNEDYPGFFGGPEVTSRFADSLITEFHYFFKNGDKPGTWKFLLYLSNKEIINYPFEVLPAEDRSGYASLDCYEADGKINTANFYQLSPMEKDWMDDGENSFIDLLPMVRYGLQKRVTLCLAADNSINSIDRWEHYFKQFSGEIPVLQNHPSVDERIVAAMPVFEEEFMFVNKDFVVWFAQNMVPNPEAEQFNGLTFQVLYDQMFREHVRNLAMTSLYYMSLQNPLDHQVEYAKRAARKYVEDEVVKERTEYIDILGFVADRYETDCSHWVQAHLSDNDHSAVSFQFNATHMAFWIRRGIDGSANELWLALREVLQKYDQYWYESYVAPNWAP